MGIVVDIFFTEITWIVYIPDYSEQALISRPFGVSRVHCHGAKVLLMYCRRPSEARENPVPFDNYRARRSLKLANPVIVLLPPVLPPIAGDKRKGKQYSGKVQRKMASSDLKIL